MTAERVVLITLKLAASFTAASSSAFRAASCASAAACRASERRLKGAAAVTCEQCWDLCGEVNPIEVPFGQHAGDGLNVISHNDLQASKSSIMKNF
jgi:hypothetical protein